MTISPFWPYLCLLLVIEHDLAGFGSSDHAAGSKLVANRELLLIMGAASLQSIALKNRDTDCSKELSVASLQEEPPRLHS